jgi:hypothetical protein
MNKQTTKSNNKEEKAKSRYNTTNELRLRSSKRFLLVFYNPLPFAEPLPALRQEHSTKLTTASADYHVYN